MHPLTKSDGIYLGNGDYSHPFDKIFINDYYQGGEISLTCSNHGKQTIHLNRFKIKQHQTPAPVSNPDKLDCNLSSNENNKVCIDKKKKV